MTARLPEILAPHVDRLEFIGCPADPLHHSPFVRESWPVGSHEQCDRFTVSLTAAASLLADLPSWTLWGSDIDLIRMARSALPTADKVRILPARTERGLAMLGSKTGLATLAAELDLPQPHFEVAATPTELVDISRRWHPPHLLKGERGGGSSRIRYVGIERTRMEDPVPDHWLPVLVQEMATGTEVAVDAMFSSGRLAAWTYAETSRREHEFGLSSVRRYCDPDNEDFAEILATLGEAAGLHGFANCTFVRSEPSGLHLLLECDMRANAWFPFGPSLGVDWGATMRSSRVVGHAPARPRFGGGREAVVRLYPRQIAHAINRLSWTDLRPWLTRAPGTWEARLHRDPVINAAERAEIWREISRLPARALGRARRITWPTTH